MALWNFNYFIIYFLLLKINFLRLGNLLLPLLFLHSFLLLLLLVLKINVNLYEILVEKMIILTTLVVII